jgi:muramidase (phage lysozyme)
MNQGTRGNKIIGSTNDASTILGKNLTEMTMKEVLKFQSKGKLFAAGRYQIVPDTMKSSMRRAGVTESDIFNTTTQDKLGSSLIYGNKRAKLRDYLIGKSDNIDAANLDFAKEWASVPSPGPCKGEPDSLV